jgi:limonene-1,2-epoxide hydrolase
MKTNTHAEAVEKAPAQVVLSFIKALNAEDFASAKRYVNKDMTFEGVMGSRNGADAYFADMEKMRFKYNVKKVFEDGEDVCLFYDIDMGGGKNLFCAGWYHLKEGRIADFKVIFDPRPLLEGKDKKN